jgi:nitrogen fixation protein FixH
MTTFNTLFGGLLAVVVLYFLLGFARQLPPLFRALIAGGVPLVAYFASLVGAVWPGLDAIAIHISVFIAAAALLHILGEFRRKHGRLHWVPRLLIAFFILLAVINASLLHIATKGLPEPIASWWLGDKVEAGFSGVVEHGQRAAKGVSAGLAQTHQKTQLGWKIATEGLLQDGAATRDVTVRARDRTGLPLAGLAARVELSRPGTPVVVETVSLIASDSGVYAGRVVLPAPGRWLATLVLERGEAKFSETRELIVPASDPSPASSPAMSGATP